MTPPADPKRYKNHRFPGEIISHGVWLYYRFPLSYRDVQELLCERGIDVTHEAIRQWCLKFGQDYANRLKRRRAQPGDKWHLDEVFVTINGKRHYLWRAVDQDDNVLDILIQSRRNKHAPEASSCRRGRIEKRGGIASRVGPKSRVRSGLPREQIGPERGGHSSYARSASTT